MNLEVGGKSYSDFTASTLNIRLDHLANSFSFSTGITPQIREDISLGDQCFVNVDGESAFSGEIEIIQGSGTFDDGTIDYIGRDFTSDIVDSDIGSISEIAGSISLKRLIEIYIEHINSDVEVIDLSTGTFFRKEEGNLNADPGENVFSYLEKLSRKKGAILTSNGDGNLVIRNLQGPELDVAIVNRAGSTQGQKIIRWGFEYNNTGLFNNYTALGNQNLGIMAKLGRQNSGEVVNQKGVVTDQLIREGRQMVLTSENPGDISDMRRRARWESNVRRARSRSYTATVDGYRNVTGDLWAVNTLIRVIDDLANIDDTLLIESVTFRDDGDGKTTQLGFANRNAYSLAAEEPEPVKKEEFDINAAFNRKD